MNKVESLSRPLECARFMRDYSETEESCESSTIYHALQILDLISLS
jgi:hypothetical protein